jgi:hypothetical protein
MLERSAYGTGQVDVFHGWDEVLGVRVLPLCTPPPFFLPPPEAMRVERIDAESIIQASVTGHCESSSVSSVERSLDTTRTKEQSIRQSLYV